MNAFFGILRLDGQASNPDQLERCTFKSQHWRPDHQDCLIKNNLALVCTQRFVTPEAARGLMPYQDSASGCIIIADTYLTYRAELAEKLGVKPMLADCELLLLAYLKWGHDCTKHLTGNFTFAIWDPRQQKLFLAVDHFCHRTCFYSYEPGKYFMFANTMTPFRVFCQHLTINTELMAHFVLDSLPEGMTCYHEVKKILPGQQLILSSQSLQKQSYWQLKKHALPYKKREDYYQAFRELFSTTVQQYMHSDYAISAHISGGLDSSSVASTAAKILAEKNRPLYGFTAIPRGLEGPSYRDGWYYHEMPRVEEILKQYPNIIHHIYTADPTTNPFSALETFYPWIDQPFRNISNFDWILASYQKACDSNSRILLDGQGGNGSISWTGQSLRNMARAVYDGIKIWLQPTKIYDGYFAKHHPDLLQKTSTKKILRQRNILINRHRWMLIKNIMSARRSSIRPIWLWYGIEALDPTNDLKLVEFCYSVPQWVYYKSNEKLQRRLLTREALVDIVPEAIRYNPYRGEQAADWYLQYNHHATQWREKILEISKTEIGDTLWQWYKKEAMLNLFDDYSHISQPSKEASYQICHNLMRCLELGFYLNYLHQK